MLINASRKIRRHTGVERAVGRSGQDVDEGLSVHFTSREQGRSRLKAGMTEPSEVQLADVQFSLSYKVLGVR